MTRPVEGVRGVRRTPRCANKFDLGDPKTPGYLKTTNRGTYARHGVSRPVGGTRTPGTPPCESPWFSRRLDLLDFDQVLVVP